MGTRQIKVVLSKSRNMGFFEIEKIENALFVKAGEELFSAGNRLQPKEAQQLIDNLNIDVVLTLKGR